MLRKPNVILITTDQLRPFELGCYGHPLINTPHIDRLATEGFRFVTAVTGNPVCVPARSCLLSGQYSRTCAGALNNAYADDGPARERLRLPDPTIAEAFGEAGYDTALIGKWHIHPHPLSVGFDTAIYPRVPHRYSEQTYYEGYGDAFVVNGFSGDFELEQAHMFFRRQKERSKNPFFLYYNISLPHMPVWEGVPDRYRTMYSPDEVVLRDNVFVNKKMSRNEHWFKVYTYADFFWEWLDAKRAGRTDFDESDWPLPQVAGQEFDLRSLYSLYYGNVSYADDTVGALRREIAECGLDGNTIIAFVSDHGDNLGSHDLYNKGRLIEESVRIPLVFYAPKRIGSGVSKTHIASLIDVMPTLLDLVEIPTPSPVQGRSLMRVLAGDVPAIEPNRAFIETDGHEIGIRTPRWTYGMQLDPITRKAQNEGICLHDNETDLYQTTNLVGIECYADIENSLRGQLIEFDRATSWLDV